MVGRYRMIRRSESNAPLMAIDIGQKAYILWYNRCSGRLSRPPLCRKSASLYNGSEFPIDGNQIRPTRPRNRHTSCVRWNYVASHWRVNFLNTMKRNADIKTPYSSQPTNVKGRALATRTEGCEFESQLSLTKDLKNGNRYTQLSAKLESDIDKPERWLSSGWMLCERLLCPNGGIKRTRTSCAWPSLVTVHPENWKGYPG